ncbi:patatin-like protein [Sphingomonas jatrophae]|uniref:patatin-like protein n=1 Tax=Sphingomonas jatrophae TaxID=1166337 RepID=UPI000B805905|nr:patatin-like protein [Sphingomonas jatrophae]
MREKELRLALVCYGGISLAVYMHGVTKEVWRLVRASRAFHAGEAAGDGSEAIYRALLEAVEQAGDTRLRVLADIIAGASAGGINGVFLAQAIATGQSLEPLTQLWLETADVERLLTAPATGIKSATKLLARPLARWAAARSETIEADVDPAVQEEVRAKLARFMSATWFQPPFDGTGFTALLLDAFEAMAAAPAGKPLIPPGQPLDLFVTVTDFQGHPERLRLHSPPEVVETEHRLVIGFSGRAGELGHMAELTFAARATASFPGAFPPFTVAELDGVLGTRGREWPSRTAFLARALPRQAAAGAAERAVLIDGSVLANAPFRPAIEALRNRPAHREVERRFVYIDPKPGQRSVRLNEGGDAAPGYFQTIFGALSDIPREQPIRDALEAIETRNQRIARTRATVAAIRPQVEAAVADALGGTFFLDSPTPGRLASWRLKANAAAARAAGFAYAGYGQLKLAGVIEDAAALLAALGGRAGRPAERIAEALWTHLSADGLAERLATGASDAQAIAFFRAHDLGFRIRRLRALARRVDELDAPTSDDAAMEAVRVAIFASLGRYLEREGRDWFDADCAAAAGRVLSDPGAALEAVAAQRDLKPIDDAADAALAMALSGLDRAERRMLLLAYLGFPFEDIATLPLLAGVGRDEFNPVQVDRISPDDAATIRSGGAEATLKGIKFNSFGAFFARAYRENDYLWGRLHGAERLIDIVVSALPRGVRLPPGKVAALKQAAFRAVLAEERERLGAVPDLIAALEGEVG